MVRDAVSIKKGMGWGRIIFERHFCNWVSETRKFQPFHMILVTSDMLNIYTTLQLLNSQIKFWYDINTKWFSKEVYHQFGPEFKIGAILQSLLPIDHL